MKYIFRLLFFALVFYHIFPQGLSVFGSSFIFASGVIGLGLFVYERAPVPETKKIFAAYLPITFMCLLTFLINNLYYDPFWWDSVKTIFGYYFSAYLIIMIFNKLHPNGSIQTIVIYIVAAIIAQGIISILMDRIPVVNSFFEDLMLMDELTKFKRLETKGERLLGYGIAFFGAGIIYGFGLILLIFILMTKKTNQLGRIFLAICYAFIFYVGLLSARTTMIGGGASLVLLILLFVKGKQVKISTEQLILFFVIIIVILGIGQTLCYLYYRDFYDWAFEAFTNYKESGELRTDSSDGLSNMWAFPQTVQGWIFGDGHMLFRGTDIGFSRLLLYIGIPGTLAYFYFQYVVMKTTFTQYKSLNYTVTVLFLYNLFLNVKGLADINTVTFIIFFYVMYHKYYIVIPERQKVIAMQRKEEYYRQKERKEELVETERKGPILEKK
ncbi:hypothetical protein [Dysgonomonas sp. 520]|uniref:hypothetical protein n=1 Tax=Dysgonomonas sp. 520 TaxID=2302931 RepID=UPI0013D797AF|nr:hypothetical protein [Dysgonomonas sp. 520]NDW09237.1 hypothetical protein [Dysgonomonas sp. 520]